jgi:hypothetical protein
MNAAPILQCADWPQLVSALAGRDEFSGLATLRPGVASAVLAAPAAIARSIAESAPELAARRELSVIVVGAEATDAPDDGRWYQAIPAMLGGNGAIRVTLAGSSLDTAFTSAASTCAPATPALCVCSGLAEYLDANDGAKFDIAAVFQPGFQKYRDWLDDNGFARLLSAGTFVMGSSYATDEYQMERWVLECYGYRASEQPSLNPFYLELGDAKSSIRWGGALWQIEAAPPRDFTVDAPKLAALDTLTRMVLHSMTVVGEPSPPGGATLELTAGNGQCRSMIHVFDRRFLDASDGSLVQLTIEGDLKAIGRLPEADVRNYPRTTSGDIERAIWAADIKARFLLDTYPATGAGAAGAAIARDMFGSLRARAASLFK